MLATFSYISGKLAEKFPNIPILSAVGNNDCYYHDSAPGVANATEYYSELKQTMFDTVPANANITADSDFLNSWMEGGYYKT